MSFSPRSGRTAVTAALTVGSLVLLSACGSSPQPADGSTDAGSATNKTIVFSPLSLQIPAMKGLSEGVKEYATSKGYQVIVQDPAGNPQKQTTDLQSVIESGRAAGAYSVVVQAAGMKALVDRAIERKIPLVLTGVPADYGLSGPTAGISFSTIDYAAQGEAIGTELGNCINEKLGGKAKVIMQINQEAGTGDAQSQAAAQKALTATAPGAQIVQTIAVRDRAVAQTDMGNALQGKPDVTAVLGNNDEGALGALGAFAAAGKELACVTEVGGNDEAQAAVKSGKIYAVVAMQFHDDLVQNVDTLIKMIEDPSTPGVQLTVPQKVLKAGS